MPSSENETTRTTRRRVLTAVGATTTGVLAGCAGRVPGTGPEELPAETVTEENGVRWEFPSRDSDTDGIGYASVTVEKLGREQLGPTLALDCNCTIGGLASSEPDENYTLDWFRFRFGPPPTFEGHGNFEVRVQPPGQWEEFSAYYDHRGARREFVIELTATVEGTVITPCVFDSVVDSLPEKLYCAVTVQASRSGLFGKTVRTSDEETLTIGELG